MDLGTFLIKTSGGQTVKRKGNYYIKGIYDDSITFYQYSFLGMKFKKLGYFSCKDSFSYITEIIKLD